MLRTISCCVLSLALVAFARAEDAKDKTAKADAVKQAQAVADAMTKGDYEAVMDRTYPAIVEALGGKQAAAAAATTAMKQLSDKGAKFVSCKIGDAGDLFIEGTNTFLVIPTTNEITLPQGKMVGKSYLLGISPDSGKTWSFVDGAGLEKNQKRLPKLPAKLELPKPTFELSK